MIPIYDLNKITKQQKKSQNVQLQAARKMFERGATRNWPTITIVSTQKEGTTISGFFFVVGGRESKHRSGSWLDLNNHLARNPELHHFKLRLREGARLGLLEYEIKEKMQSNLDILKWHGNHRSLNQAMNIQEQQRRGVTETLLKERPTLRVGHRLDNELGLGTGLLTAPPVNWGYFVDAVSPELRAAFATATEIWVQQTAKRKNYLPLKKLVWNTNWISTIMRDFVNDGDVSLATPENKSFGEVIQEWGIPVEIEIPTKLPTKPTYTDLEQSLERAGIGFEIFQDYQGAVIFMEAGGYYNNGRPTAYFELRDNESFFSE